MYFPYLRGRQYELIAIRELIENKLIDEKIIPIIEPIKPTPTLLITLETVLEYEQNIAIITNPQVGNFIDELESLKDETYKQRYRKILNSKYVIKAHIFNNNSTNEINALLSESSHKKDILLIHNRPDFLDLYDKNFSENDSRFNLIPDESPFRRRIKENKVLFADRFPKQPRNVDYLEQDDNFFCEDHLFFPDEGYAGFSDFSIVGADFVESGFAPMAVAIHIVYFAKDSTLRIKHFVSDSNEDISDPAGKFYEALQKLIQWNKAKEIDTYAMKKFQRHYDNETYPGLGSLKKLSIMHHIELMNGFLNRRK